MAADDAELSGLAEPSSDLEKQQDEIIKILLTRLGMEGGSTRRPNHQNRRGQVTLTLQKKND